MTTCPYFDNAKFDIFDADAVQCHFITLVLLAGSCIVSVMDRNVFELTEKIKLFRSECLKILENEYCYGNF